MEMFGMGYSPPAGISGISWADIGVNLGSYGRMDPICCDQIITGAFGSIAKLDLDLVLVGGETAGLLSKFQRRVR
jgi:hypothetical protein